MNTSTFLSRSQPLDTYFLFFHFLFLFHFPFISFISFISFTSSHFLYFFSFPSFPYFLYFLSLFIIISVFSLSSSFLCPPFYEWICVIFCDLFAYTLETGWLCIMHCIVLVFLFPLPLNRRMMIIGLGRSADTSVRARRTGWTLVITILLRFTGRQAGRNCPKKYDRPLGSVAY